MTRKQVCLELLAQCFAAENVKPLTPPHVACQRATIATIFALSECVMRGDHDSLYVETSPEHSILVYFFPDYTVRHTVFRQPGRPNTPTEQPTGLIYA